jgi:hypothetical protein
MNRRKPRGRWWPAAANTQVHRGMKLPEAGGGLRQMSKSFLVLFFKKELLPAFQFNIAPSYEW